MSALPSLVQVVGSQSSPVKNVAVKDLVVARTSSNLFAPFEALGGGDQAIERGGAVFAEALTNASCWKCCGRLWIFSSNRDVWQGVEGFEVAGCEFVDVGGNGVVISGYSRSARLTGNTFLRL